MNLTELRNLSPEVVNSIRGETRKIPDFPFQVAHINLDNENDPSAILKKYSNSLTVISDSHSYRKKDRIFPVNQDENTVFSQYVYRDSMKVKYRRVLDLCTGTGVIAMALSRANRSGVVATDINPRARSFVVKNCRINNVTVRFIESDLFNEIKGEFEKITIDPPFMPAPEGTFPLHAQGGCFGTENVVEPFFRTCWDFVKDGGCIQGIFHSLANDDYDTVLALLEKYMPRGWSYVIKHVFPVKNMPIEMYTTSFIGQENFTEWRNKIDKKHLKYMRFFMVTIRNNGKNGMRKEETSKPRLYNIIYPPTSLMHLSKHNKTKILQEPVSENEYPAIGHLMRLSRYNYFVYMTLCDLLR